MRYYDTIDTPLTGKTFLEKGSNRIAETDTKVISWFQSLPDGYKRAYDADGLPFNELIPLPTPVELSELAATQYQCDRADAYPSIVDQLDDIYHNGVAGWKASIKAVKDQYPKPE
jgi:hypothetical protein